MAVLAINQMGENAQLLLVHLVQDQMYQVASKLVVVKPPPSLLCRCCNFSNRLMVIWTYIVICNLTILDEMETNLRVQVFLTECDTTPGRVCPKSFAVHYVSVANVK